jgi:hypothetical protein
VGGTATENTEPYLGYVHRKMDVRNEEDNFEVMPKMRGNIEELLDDLEGEVDAI